MKPSRVFNILSKRLMPFGPETTVADVGVATTVETAAVVEEAGVVVSPKPNPPKVRVPNTQIYPLESGQDAKCTENLVEEHTFVVSPLHALGRMSTLRALLNEILTSLAAQKKHRFMTLYIITIKPLLSSSYP